MDTHDQFSLAQEIGTRLLATGSQVTTAESCTGGGIACALTDVAGSSGWFERGYITYSNTAKADMLGVDHAAIARDGAVSQIIVEQMALGALAAANADYAVAVSGVAGPGGGSEEKPVGTVWIGWAVRDGQTRARCFHFPGDRAAVRAATVQAALEGVLARLS